MERISLPPHVLAKQQKITVEPNGEITRDRMVIVQQKEIVPMMDPVMRDYMINEMAEKNVARNYANAAPITGFWFTVSFIISFPFFIWFINAISVIWSYP